jgi:hypothetical protein
LSAFLVQRIKRVVNEAGFKFSHLTLSNKKSLGMRAVGTLLCLLQLHGSDNEVTSFVLLHSTLPDSSDRKLCQLIAMRVLSLCNKVIKRYNAKMFSYSVFYFRA